MSYTDYVIRRLIQNAFVLFGLSILIFGLSRILPGDPVRLALGRSASEEQVQNLREIMGLNEPLYIQYVDWFQGVLQGQWGRSLRTGNNVLFDILSRFSATFELVSVAIIFAVVLAIPFGVISGMNKDKWPDHLSRLVTLFGVSLPRFWVAILFQLLFVAYLGWLPLIGRLSSDVQPPPDATGLYLVDSLLAGQLNVFVDAAVHLILPAAALGLATLAQVTRLIRSSMIEEEREDYVLAARAYGLPRNMIEYKYMLKNAFTSSLTIIGLSFGFLMGNAFLIELIFSWPGMARYGVNAILFRDFNGIVGIVIVIGFIFVTVNLVVDLLYAYLDPRVRSTEGQTT